MIVPNTTFSTLEVTPLPPTPVIHLDTDPRVSNRFDNFNISAKMRSDARSVIAHEYHNRDLSLLNWGALSRLANMLAIEHKKSTPRDILIHGIRSRLAE